MDAGDEGGGGRGRDGMGMERVRRGPLTVGGYYYLV